MKNWLKGALKSWTVWLSALLAAAPEILPALQANFSVLTPFIPDGSETRTLQVIGVLVFLLRLKTTTSLASKGGS